MARGDIWDLLSHLKAVSGQAVPCIWCDYTSEITVNHNKVLIPAHVSSQFFALYVLCGVSMVTVFQDLHKMKSAVSELQMSKHYWGTLRNNIKADNKCIRAQRTKWANPSKKIKRLRLNEDTPLAEISLISRRNWIERLSTIGKSIVDILQFVDDWLGKWTTERVEVSSRTVRSIRRDLMHAFMQYCIYTRIWWLGIRMQFQHAWWSVATVIRRYGYVISVSYAFLMNIVTFSRRMSFSYEPPEKRKKGEIGLCLALIEMPKDCS